jgi:hypothetical protein
MVEGVDVEPALSYSVWGALAAASPLSSSVSGQVFCRENHRMPFADLATVDRPDCHREFNLTLLCLDRIKIAVCLPMVLVDKYLSQLVLKVTTGHSSTR